MSVKANEQRIEKTPHEDHERHGLTGAVLYTEDLQRLVDFYAAVVGLEVRSQQTGFSILGRQPPQFVTVRIPKRIADTIDIVTPPARREDTPVKLVFSVDDIASVRNKAVALGGAMNAVEREWEFEGAKVCDGHDPEGNVFQVRQTV